MQLEMLDRDKILRRGRRRVSASDFVGLGLRKVAGIFTFLALGIFLAGLISPVTRRTGVQIAVSQGQARIQPDFARSRGYIHYRISGTGKRYWYGTIAERFQVSQGWKEIAATTLGLERNPVAANELETSQYKLEAGQEVKVPINDAAKRR